MNFDDPNVLEYEERIKQIIALYKSNVNDDEKVLIADVIIER